MVVTLSCCQPRCHDRSSSLITFPVPLLSCSLLAFLDGAPSPPAAHLHELGEAWVACTCYALLSAFVFSLQPPRCDTRLGLPLLPSAATQADSSSSSSAFACIVATPWVIFILAATEANRRRCSLYPRARCAPLLTDPRAPESHLFRIVSFVALGHRLHYTASTLRRVDRERGRWLRD